MDYNTGSNLYNQISETKQQDLLNDLVLSAVEYAKIRSDWYVSDKKRQIELNERRKAFHETLIDSCNILSSEMAKNGENISWRETLDDERVDIRDFACYLHCITGIKAG